MRVVNKDEFFIGLEDFKADIAAGKVFIYPTDTIYSLGCDATNPESVKKIRDIKERTDTSFSVMAPSKQWIYDNCVLDEEGKEWVEKLPGPFTLKLTLKNREAVCREVTLGEETISVRIPTTWLRGIARQVDKPFIITAVNKMGKKPMTNVDDLDPEIKGRVSFIIDEGTIKGVMPKMIHLEVKR